MQSYKELERELKNKVRSSERAQLSKKVIIDRLKNKYTITENEVAKAIFNRKDIRNIVKDSLKAIILTINDKSFTQEDFVNFIKRKNNVAVFQLFNDFKDQEILGYYKDNLEKVEPEFAYTIQEYRDGLLLFELMQQKIWNKSSKDTLGLKNFFDANLSKFKTKELKKIKGEVMNDYQSFLEKNWIADLKNKSSVSVNEKQLKKLIKFYKKK